MGFQRINMHQPVVQHRFAPAVAGPLAQIGADYQNQVHSLILHRRNGGAVTGKAEHAAVQRMARTDKSLGVGCDHENPAHPFHQLDDETNGFAATATDQHHQLLGLGQ